MQTESSRARFRGWRESRRLVEKSKSVPADLKDVTSAANSNDVSYDLIVPLVETLTDTQVSLIQRVRIQLRLRIRSQRII